MCYFFMIHDFRSSNFHSFMLQDATKLLNFIDSGFNMLFGEILSTVALIKIPMLLVSVCFDFSCEVWYNCIFSSTYNHL